MVRGNQIILLGILLVIIAGVGSYLYLNKLKKDYLPSTFALPESAIFVYQGQHFRESFAALEQNDFYAALNDNDALRNFDKDYHYFDSLLNADERIQKSLAVRPLVVSLHATSASNYQLLFLHQTEHAFRESDIQDMVKEMLPDSRLMDHTFDGVKIYDIRTPAKESLFSFSFLEGIVIISRNTMLVEDAISAFKGNKHKNNTMLRKIVEQAGQDKLYINYSQLPLLASIYADDRFHESIRQVQDAAAFGEYDWKLEKEKLSLEGTVFTEKGDLWHLLLSQQPQPLHIQDVLPPNTAFLMAWGAGDFAVYHKDHKDYLETHNEKDSLEARQSRLLAEQGVDVEKDLIPLVGKEWAYVRTEPVSEEQEQDAIMVLKAPDSTGVMEQLHILNMRTGAKKLSTTTPVEYRNYTIYRTEFKGAFQLLLGQLFADFEQPFYTQLGDYVLFSQSSTQLQRCIDAFIDKQTLDKTTSWQQFSANLASQSNFLCYINPSRALLLGSRYARDNYKERYRQNFETYKQVAGFGFQLVSNQNSFFSKISMTQASGKGQGSEQVWSQPLEADPATKPFIVANAMSSQKEILIQDKNNNLYLFSNTGSIIWKTKLDGPMEGEVYQVDYYRNDQLQYLLSTENKIYLLDHDGQNVGNYPIRLGTATNTGIALFDFNNIRDYRYFVGGDKNRIYGFSLDGRPLAGWAPMQADGSLSTPLKYFSQKNDIYVFGVTDKGTLYVWNELGKQVVKPVSQATRFENPFKITFGANVQQDIVFSLDTTGILYSIRLDGQTQKRKFRGASHAFFDYYDSDGNSRPEYIISSANTIAAYEKDTAAKWRVNTAEKLVYPPQFIKLGNQTWVNYTSVPTNQVYLVSRAGTVYQGFPKTGNTQAAADDLNGDGITEMVVGGEGKVLNLYRLGQ